MKFIERFLDGSGRAEAAWKALSAAVLLLAVCPAAADITSYALVQADGTLKVRGRLIHLYGVYMPESGKTCQRFVRPSFCGNRAAVALDFKIGADFVSCEPLGAYPDRSLSAVCRVDGEDLGAYLIEAGLAVAGPDAPFEYGVMERLARHREIGLWGMSVDALSRRRH